MKNLWLKIKWGLVIVPVGIFGLTTCWYMFPIAWVIRNIPILKYLGWPWMDDSRFKPDGSYENDYQIHLDSRGLEKENFAVAYYWHCMRNRVWNIVDAFGIPNHFFDDGKAGNNNIEIVEIIKDDLHKYDGTPIKQDTRWVATAQMKYVGEPGQDPWQVNKGDILSNRTSIIGTGEIIYKVGNWTSWRYSQAKIVDYKIFGIRIWKGWRIIKAGTNCCRYMVAFKHKAIKPWDIDLN